VDAASTASSQYRLEEKAIQAFVDIMLDGRKPIAVVGSGLSMIYGGVTWGQSVEMALDYAVGVIDRLLALDPGLIPPNVCRRLQSHREALHAMQDEGAIATSPDKYVALDLCSEALGFVDAWEAELRRQVSGLDRAVREALSCSILEQARMKDPQIGRFLSYMAALYKNDTLLVRYLLEKRFLQPGGSVADLRVRKRLEALDDRQIHKLARTIYSISFYRQIAAQRSEASELITELEVWLKKLHGHFWIGDDNMMPVDRRAAITLLLAELPYRARLSLLRSAINQLDRQARP